VRWIGQTNVLSIRPYHQNDREGLFKIAADTAFFGQPIEIYMEDRRIFLDAFYAYYTDYEPEHCWVATANDEVVGFLTGCVDTLKKDQIVNKKINPKVLFRLIRGYYKVGPKARQYLNRMWRSKRQHLYPSVDLDQYPAHLHINVDEHWRGFGIGVRLMKVYLDQLSYLRVPGVHLGTSSENIAACQLYEKLGFQLLEEKPSIMWEGIVDHPVISRAYGLNLGGDPILSREL
jgi:ribosomal protein S18 acetylase RimI-like enzyme